MAPIVTLFFTIMVLIFTGCLYQNEEELFGKPDSACDTTAVTFSASVLPILQESCLSCHSAQQVAEGAGGGNNLENFTVIRNLAFSGRLLGAIEHASGYSPMPKYGNKLSDCKISIFRIWIRNGALNN